jgi:L-ascorbate metabolism protein UlaG (beta-lactamase superfamily)
MRMRIEWFGQSAFRLQTGDCAVAIDPFGVPGEALAKRGLREREVVRCDGSAFDTSDVDGPAVVVPAPPLG